MPRCVRKRVFGVIAGLAAVHSVVPALGEPAPLAAVNTRWVEKDPWLSPDGYTLYFASDREGGDFDLYQTQWDGRRWSEPAASGDLVNSDFDETQPSLSRDGRRLLFISFRGRFWRGVWICQRQADGSWGKAEFTPIHTQEGGIWRAVIGADGETIIFESRRNDRRGDSPKLDMVVRYDQGGRFWGAPRPYSGRLPTDQVPHARWRFVARDGDIFCEPTGVEDPAAGDTREVLDAVSATSTWGGEDECYWVSEAQNLIDGLADTSWVSRAGTGVVGQSVLLRLNGHAKYVPGLSRIHRLRIHTGPLEPVRIDHEKKGRRWSEVWPAEPAAGTRPKRLRILGGFDAGALDELAVIDVPLDSRDPWYEVRLPEPRYMRYLRVEVLAAADPDAPYVAFNEVEAYGAGLSARRPVHHVSTDEHNNILVDGRPFFPVYIYNAKADTRVAEYGFNTSIQTYDVASDMARLEILDRACDAGFMVLGHVPWVETEADRKKARNQLLAMRHHPALLGYLMSDEAGHSKEIMQRDERRSAFIHKYDEHHFTMLNDLYPAYYGRSSSFVDVFSIDPYPHIVGQPYSYQAFAVDKAYECVKHGKPVFVVNASWGRIISPVENRLNVYLALIHGAKGISWYALGVRWQDADHWASIERCVREIHRLEPVLFAPEAGRDSPLLTHSKIENPSARIDVMIREVGGEVWMLAANCEPREAQVRFSFGWSEEITIREVMRDRPEAWSMKRRDFTLFDPWPPPEDREPVRSARPIELTFDPYEVRVFRMRPSSPIGPHHEPIGEGTQLAMTNESLQRRVAEQAKQMRAEGKHAEARRVIDAFWSKYADRVSVDDLAALMEILEDEDRPEAILSDYGRLAEEHPEAGAWPRWVFKIVQAAVRTDRRDEGRKWMRRLIEARPDSVWRANAEVLLDPASARSGRKPWTVAKRIQQAPVIDGELTEPIWQDRVSFDNTVFLDASKHPQPTEFALAYDDDALYVAIKAIEPQPDKILTRVDKDDRGVWGDDSIVVYLDPELDYFDYQQFVFNSAGAKWDGTADRMGHANAGSLDADVQRRGVVKDGAWQIEIRIPFAEMRKVDPPRSGRVWGLGVQRWRQVEGALPTVWGNERGTSHDNRPEQFGFLVFE